MLTLQGMEGFYSHFKKTAFYATTFLNNESVPPFFHDCSQNNIRFLWSSNLYKFFCLCFGIRSAPKIFTKLLKIPIATLYRIIIIHIIYLDDIMLIGKNLEEILLKQDTLIFLLQKLSILVNSKKSLFKPTHQIEFSGLIINTLPMTLSSTEEKLTKLKPNIPGRDMKKTDWHVVVTVQAVLPARFQYRYLQDP